MKIRSSCSLAFRLVVIGVALAALGGAGCGRAECGEGTREVDGKCFPVNPIHGDGGIHCGGNTVLAGTECVPAESLCGPYTRVVYEVDDAGVRTGYFLCEGEGSGPTLPECHPPSSIEGTICVNGFARYFMYETGSVLTEIFADPEAAEDATKFTVFAYDPLEYVNDPTVAPLATAELNPQTGIFIVEHVRVPASGFIALVIDERDGEATDDVAFTGIPFKASTSTNLLGVTAAVVTNAQVDDWTAKIGGDAVLSTMGCALPPTGTRTLATCGTWVGLMYDGQQNDPGQPVEGAQPQFNSVNVVAAETFYLGYSSGTGVVFDDTTEGLVWSDAGGPHEWSGVSGIIFYPTAQLGQYRGFCANDTECKDRGCGFPGVLGGSAPGAMFVQYIFPYEGSCSPAE